jgi:predicted transposase/invertase (TIGR01784 family)
MKQVASLRYGVIFKKAFSKPHIFKAFVKDFLGIELDIDEVETEKSFAPAIGRVDSRFDLFAEDKKHPTIVDIQHERRGDHYDRFLHYHCAALLEQVTNAKDYRPALKVYTIVLLTSGDKHQADIATIDFDPKDRQGKPLREIAHKILYVCPKYVTDDTPEPYRQWLLAIEDSLDESVDESCYTKPEIQAVFDLIEKDKTTPQEYAHMKDEYSLELLINDSYKKGKKETARKMREVGLDLELIMKITGLSQDELDAPDECE